MHTTNILFPLTACRVKIKKKGGSTKITHSTETCVCTAVTAHHASIHVAMWQANFMLAHVFTRLSLSGKRACS